MAPFLRGYAPTAVPADGHYQMGALVRDVNALHEALGGGDDAVLIGHDWGALATYGAVAHQPERWRRAVTAAVPPTASIGMSLLHLRPAAAELVHVLLPVPLAEVALPLDDYAFIDRPVARLVARLRRRVGRGAGEGVHRRPRAHRGGHRLLPRHVRPALQVPELADEQAASLLPTPKPTLYLHGRDDGCMLLSSMGAPLDFLAEGSEVEVIDDAGHFLHVERPDVVNRRILEFLTA